MVFLLILGRLFAMNKQFFLVIIMGFSGSFLNGMEEVVTAQGNDALKNLNAQFCTAAQKGDCEQVGKLLAMGADVNAQSLQGGETALAIAALNGYETLCTMLINTGANPNIQDVDGDTALICAAHRGFAGICSMLLQAGANTQLQDRLGRTAAMCAKSNGHEAIWQLFQSKHDNSQSVQIDIPQPELKTCPLCFDDKAKREFITLGCGHDRICIECLNDQIEHGLDRNWREAPSLLRCSEPNCLYLMNENDIRFITCNEQKVTRLSEVLLQLLIDSTKTIRRCPSPGCENAYILDENQKPKAMTCSSCNLNYCSHCCTPHSSGISCDAAKNTPNDEKLKELERLSQEWINANTKACPRCKKAIEKNGGCLHMTCKRQAGGCGHEFCWRCSRTWNMQEHESFYECTFPAANPEDQSFFDSLTQHIQARLAELTVPQMLQAIRVPVVGLVVCSLLLAWLKK